MTTKLIDQGASVKLINLNLIQATARQTWIVTGAYSMDNAMSSCALLGYTTQTLYSQVCLCDSITASVLPESAAGALVYKVEVTFNSTVESTFNAYSSEIGGAYVDCYRTQTSFGTGDPDAYDIGGTKLDRAGVPISRLCVQSTVSTSRRYTTVPWSAIWSAVGKRNSDAYNGASVGQLLMRGVSVQTVSSGIYEVQYKYESDEFFHMRQVATREEADQRVWLENGQAKEVKNIQPFPNKVQFSSVIT